SDHIFDRNEWPTLHAVAHNASTLGGNSGSLVVDLDSEKVLAVHFAGEAFKTNWANPTWELYRDARIRDCGVLFDDSPTPSTVDPEVEKAWTALSKRAFSAVPEGLSGNGSDKGATLPDLPPPPDLGGSGNGTAQELSTTVVHIDVPLEITIRVLAPVVGGGAPQATIVGAPRTESALEGINVDPDYGSRTGYDPDHLDVHVPLPTLTAEAMELVSPDLTRKGKKDDHLLHYHHFSLVMNKRRRLAFFTACNTTRDAKLFGNKSRAALSGGDTWILDPRLPASHQISTQELYGPSPFDRGHIVRREDAYWGMTNQEREAGNFDTFHYTNCSPQDPAYNQSSKRGIWGELENRIGEQSRNKGLRMSLLAGPVLGAQDPVLWGVRVPLQFWKVVLCVDDSSRKLKAFAFLLSQSKLVSAVHEEGVFDPGDLKAFQVTVARIEQLGAVRFAEVVKNADVRRKSTGGEESISLESLASVQID
ncbi:MAG: DNA/RNA non-specific endonuclease, partial [Minicystis sp.]